MRIPRTNNGQTQRRRAWQTNNGSRLKGAESANLRHSSDRPRRLRCAVPAVPPLLGGASMYRPSRNAYHAKSRRANLASDRWRRPIFRCAHGLFSPCSGCCVFFWSWDLTVSQCVCSFRRLPCPAPLAAKRHEKGEGSGSSSRGHSPPAENVPTMIHCQMLLYLPTHGTMGTSCHLTASSSRARTAAAAAASCQVWPAARRAWRLARPPTTAQAGRRTPSTPPIPHTPPLFPFHPHSAVHFFQLPTSASYPRPRPPPAEAFSRPCRPFPVDMSAAPSLARWMDWTDGRMGRRSPPPHGPWVCPCRVDSPAAACANRLCRHPWYKTPRLLAPSLDFSSFPPSPTHHTRFSIRYLTFSQLHSLIQQPNQLLAE